MLRKFGDSFVGKCYVVEAAFCENPIVFCRVINMCSGVYIFPDTVYIRPTYALCELDTQLRARFDYSTSPSAIFVCVVLEHVAH